MARSQSRSIFPIGIAAAVGAFSLATALSATAAPTAFADDAFLVPDTSTFDATSALGYPPLVHVLQGQEQWSITGLPTDNFYALNGTDTDTTFGSITNDDFLNTNFDAQAGIGSPAIDFPLFPANTEIDLANFGGGFENEWINIPISESPLDVVAPGMSDLLITPFGDFSLFGTYFSDLATAIG